MPEQNPFELQPQQPPPQWGGMPTITPQAGEAGLGPEGSYFQLSPEAMQMMWAPQQQPQQIQLPPLPPPQPLV
jgi:hypothetical protein